MKALGIDPVHDTRSCYRSLVDAMCRPGTVHSAARNPADYAVLATLVDAETSLYTTDTRIADALKSEGRFVEAAFSNARVIHSLGSTGGLVREASRGTLKEPSRSATVVYRVETVSESRPESSRGTTIRLTGPGVPDERTAFVGLPTAELHAIADAQSQYPCGIDVIVTTDNRIAALPRSVDIAIEEGI